MTKIFFELEGTNKVMSFDREALMKDKFLSGHITKGHRIVVKRIIKDKQGKKKVIFGVALYN